MRPGEIERRVIDDAVIRRRGKAGCIEHAALLGGLAVGREDKPFVPPEHDLLAAGRDGDGAIVVVGELRSGIVALDPEVAGLDAGLRFRDVDRECRALAFAGEKGIEVAFDQADLRFFMLGQGIVAHLLNDGVRIGVEPEPAGIPEGQLGGRVGESANLLLFHEDGAELNVVPCQILGLLPFDPSVPVAQNRFGGLVAPFFRDGERLRGFKVRGKCEIPGFQPGVLDATTESLIVERNGASDLLRRKELRAGEVRAPDFVGAARNGPIGSRNEVDRHAQKHARGKFGN